MPPKKKGKVPKKTKEQLEEERRLQEEEDARLRAEEEKRLDEERKKRELEDARRRELAAKNRAAELERLRAEYDATKLDIEGKAQRLAEILRAQKEARDWEKYLACEPRPDAQVEGDMNSFLNSWSLEVSTDIAEVAAACASATDVIDDLASVGANARATNDAAIDVQCNTFTTKIEQLMHDKIEFATRHILQYADEYTDSQSRSEVKLASVSGALKLGLWVNLVAKGSRNKRIDFPDLGIAVDLPKAVVVQSLALRVVHVPFDALSARNLNNIDCALGGVYSLELLALPPPPKRAHGWMMRDVADPTEPLKRLHYPLDGMVVSAALPVKVSLALPRYAIYDAAALRVGWWDSLAERWDEDGVTDVVLHTETNSVTFSTMKLTHVAVLQQRDLNYHKFRWHLTMSNSNSSSSTTTTTTAPNTAHLRLETEFYDAIHFEVAAAGCRLVSPQLPQLSDLLNTWLPPGLLLTKLAASGIRLCPTLDDDLRFQVTPKLKMLEDRVIDEVVSVVSAFEVAIGNLGTASTGSNDRASTKWLSALESPRQVVFAVKEIDWPYITSDVTDNNSSPDLHSSSSAELRDTSLTSAAFVNVLTEVDDDASGGGVKFRIDRCIGDNDVDDPYDTHVRLQHALDAIASPDAKDRMENANVLFEFTLQKLLRLLRLFSYSRPLCVAAPESVSALSTQLMANDELLVSAATAATDELGVDDTTAAAAAMPPIDDMKDASASEASAAHDPLAGDSM